MTPQSAGMRDTEGVHGHEAQGNGMEQETGADGALGVKAVGGPSGGDDDDRHGEAGDGEA